MVEGGSMSPHNYRLLLNDNKNTITTSHISMLLYIRDIETGNTMWGQNVQALLGAWLDRGHGWTWLDSGHGWTWLDRDHGWTGIMVGPGSWFDMVGQGGWTAVLQGIPHS